MFQRRDETPQSSLKELLRLFSLQRNEERPSSRYQAARKRVINRSSSFSIRFAYGSLCPFNRRDFQHRRFPVSGGRKRESGFPPKRREDTEADASVALGTKPPRERLEIRCRKVGPRGAGSGEGAASKRWPILCPRFRGQRIGHFYRCL